MPVRICAAIITVVVALGSAGSECAAASGAARLFTIFGRATRTTTAASSLSASLPGDLALIGDARMPSSVLPLGRGAYLVALQRIVLRVDRSGRVHRFAGSGEVGTGGDGGPATRARFREIFDLARTADGTVLVLDNDAQVVRGIDRRGVIRRVAGTGGQIDGGFAGDGGPATRALLCFPRGLAALPRGGFLIADSCNHRIRQVAADGRISTVAGTDDDALRGDGGPAVAAAIGTPDAVLALPRGGFVIASHVDRPRAGAVRAVSSAGVISTVAAVRANSIAALPDGALAVARVELNASLATSVVRLAPDGASTTLAGVGQGADSTGPPSFPFDGDTEPPAAAAVWSSDVAVDEQGAVLFTDWGDIGGRIRLIPGSRPRLAVGIERGTLRTPARVRVAYRLTRKATVTAELRRGSRLLDRRATRAIGGRHTVRFRLPVPPGRYELRLVARGPGAESARAVDRITVFPGGVLTVGAARSVVARVVRDASSAGFDPPRQCRAFGRRRVDCVVTGDGCQFIDAVVLHRDGTITERSYGGPPGNCRFQRRPHWDGDAVPQIP